MNSLSISLIYYEFTIYFANILWIHYIFREFTIIHFRIANLLWKYFVFRVYTKNSLSISQIHHEFILFYTNPLWIQFRFSEFTIFMANSLWIYLVFRDSQWIYHLHRKFTLDSHNTINSLLILRIHYYSLSNREFTLNWLIFSRIDYEFSFCSTNSLFFSLLYQKFTIYFENY